jgi:FkbH-like protein
MYEVEANSRVESGEQLAPEVLAAFGQLQGKLQARTVLPWSEHCTECAWPTCYTTCELYSPREDRRCRRFLDGMVRIEHATAVNGYLLKVRFKRWGKLWTPGTLNMLSISRAAEQESRDHRIGTILYQIPLPQTVKRFAVTKRYSYKKHMAMRKPGPGNATSFLLECFNPADRQISLTLTVRPMHGDRRVTYQKQLMLVPGFSRTRVPLFDIERLVNLQEPFGLELVPNESEDGTTLFFGVMDFVEEVATPAGGPGGPVKCVVWDLDNTLWDGVLVERGAEKLKLKPSVAEIIADLDRRGILQSVASKNNHDEAMAVLDKLQIANYFLHPQISWAPKSVAIDNIARLLNIGRDTLLFVDDSPFERSQVQSACPDVRVLDAVDLLTIPQLPYCQAPVTDESRARRQMYRVEQKRQVVAQTFSDDYQSFLKDCAIEVTLSPLAEGNEERVYELTQRTNQMNFSGTRYDRQTLRAIQQTPYLDAYVITCQDRFGTYGIVGFGVVDRREPRLTDLMFSCRIQAKRVEHAIVTHLLAKYREQGRGAFFASYRKTPRNAPSGQVFSDIGMRELEAVDGVTSLVFEAEQTIPEEAIIRLLEGESHLAGSRI